VESAEYTVIILNLVLGFGLGWPLARRMKAVGGDSSSPRKRYVLLLLVYLIESFAFAASMGTNILGVVLALVWGGLLGRRFRCLPARPEEIRKTALRFSFYTSLPAASYLCVPIVMGLGGWSVMTAADGARFGVPEFMPAPVDTITGFCAAVALTAVVGKVVITTGTVWLVARRRERSI
jgi:hypothetical protein